MFNPYLASDWLNRERTSRIGIWRRVSPTLTFSPLNSPHPPLFLLCFFRRSSFGLEGTSARCDAGLERFVSLERRKGIPTMEVANPGANGGPLPSPASLPTNPIDAHAIVDHLADLLSITLGASSEDLESHGSLLSKAKKAETIARCQRFASDTQTVLYVLKDLIPTERTNGVNGSTGMYASPFQEQ